MARPRLTKLAADFVPFALWRKRLRFRNKLRPTVRHHCSFISAPDSCNVKLYAGLKVRLSRTRMLSSINKVSLV